MDHNNSDEKKCSCGADKKNCANCQTCKSEKGKDSSSEKKYCMCEHGMCKDHNPEWETEVIDTVPNPGIFSGKNYWFKRCCGKGMTRLKKVLKQKCKKCGRRKETMTVEIAFCRCCGHRRKKEMFVNDAGPK